MNRGSALLVALLFALAPVEANAAGGENASAPTLPSSELSVTMTLYVGGIVLGTVDLTSTIRGEEYHAVSNLETAGIVNALWRETIQATSSGHIDGDRFKPALYDSFAVKDNDSKEETSLTYEGDRPPRLFVNPPFEDHVKIVVPDAEQAEALDPVSAVAFLTAGFGNQTGNPCATVAHVFDGRRRYDIEFSKEADIEVSLDNGLYKGPAVKCALSYRQMSGAGQHIIEKTAGLPIAQAWVARFPSRVVGRTYLVPLRLWANTPYGTVAAVVTSLAVDGVAQKPPGG